MFNLIKTIGNVNGQPQLIDVEISLSRGMPQLVIIGLASKSIEEAKERISSALFSCDIKPKAQRTIVNLAPADVKKTGSSYDLAIALGIFKAYGLAKFDCSKTIFIGEIGLDGKLRKTANTLPLVLKAITFGYKKIVVPKNNTPELSNFTNIEIFGIEHIKELLKIKKINDLPKVTFSPILSKKNLTLQNKNKTVDFAEIVGLDFAKRAVEIMIAGGHNLLLIGPPGVGKSTLAKATQSILPDISVEESIETSSLYSSKNLLSDGLLSERPFRAPHCSITEAAMLGGGKDLTIGEISLAHNGILFLDELSEYRSGILDKLREPIENGTINLVRLETSKRYLANFILFAATNPCPCGYKNSQVKPCICSEFTYQNFIKKFSGPILDRIDLKIYLDKVANLSEKTVISRAEVENFDEKIETSMEIKNRVEAVRNLQKNRYQDFIDKNHALNGKLSSKLVLKYLKLTQKAQEVLQTAYTKLKLSTRSYFKTIKVARTIADIEQIKTGIIQNYIEEKHIMEALQYRV